MNLRRFACSSRRLPMLGVSLLLAACGSRGGVLERLDADSALTIVTAQGLLAFAKTDARLSRSARDYIYLGPVEINERGTRTHYLWIGVASTIDRDYLNAAAPIPAVLYVEIGGAPMEFELHRVEELLPELGEVRLYEPAVSTGVVLLARITVDQLRRMSASGLPSIRVAGANGDLSEYLLWNDERPWTEFAASRGAN